MILHSIVETMSRKIRKKKKKTTQSRIFWAVWKNDVVLELRANGQGIPGIQLVLPLADLTASQPHRKKKLTLFRDLISDYRMKTLRNPLRFFRNLPMQEGSGLSQALRSPVMHLSVVAPCSVYPGSQRYVMLLPEK